MGKINNKINLNGRFKAEAPAFTDKMEQGAKGISEDDIELSHFARAIAIPIRVTIIRTILINGPWVSPDVFSDLGFSPVTRDRHLKSMVYLGIVKEKHHNRKTYYSINEETFFRMFTDFTGLFHFFKLYWIKPE